MNTLLNLLAAAGGVGAAWQLVRAASRFLAGGALGVVAEEMERTHARHGDLTALEERRREREQAVRTSRRAGLSAIGWLALLAAPSFTAWPRLLYAGYNVVWIGPMVGWVRGRRS